MKKDDLKNITTEDTPFNNSEVQSSKDFDKTQQGINDSSIVVEPANSKEPMALDDTRRVKIISPGVLVAKRFFRN